jgi:large subunit ribosomal protein L16
MLIPRQKKYKKEQKGKSFRIINSVVGLNRLKFGSVGLISLSSGRLTSKQIESMQQTINKIIKKFGTLRVNTFCDTPVSKKPIEVRMGKGKGLVDHWICKVKVGALLCEVETFFISTGIKAIRSAQIKLPLKTRLTYTK